MRTLSPVSSEALAPNRFRQSLPVPLTSARKAEPDPLVVSSGLHRIGLPEGRHRHCHHQDKNHEIAFSHLSLLSSVEFQVRSLVRNQY